MKTDWTKLKYLKESEVTCTCGCGMSDLDASVSLLFDQIRDKWGEVIRITSGVRCTLKNASCGGARQSYHIAMPERGLMGMALDIKPLQNKDLNKLHKLCLEVMADNGGVILEPTWCHIDCRPTKYRGVSEGIW